MTVHLLGHHPPPTLSLGEKGFQAMEEQLRVGWRGLARTRDRSVGGGARLFYVRTEIGTRKHAPQMMLQTNRNTT